MDEDRKPTPRSGDEELLQEIRDRYKYASDAWEEIRKERQKDMRYICGNPWDDKDRKVREDAGRPVVNHDELNQYVNQAVNNLRQNKRGINVEPGGNGADGKSAGARQDLAEGEVDREADKIGREIGCGENRFGGPGSEQLLQSREAARMAVVGHATP